jgi:serine/threonine protein kinase
LSPQQLSPPRRLPGQLFKQSLSKRKPPPVAPRKRQISTTSSSEKKEEEEEKETKYQQLYPPPSNDSRDFKNRIIKNFEDIDKHLIGSGGYGYVYSVANPYLQQENGEEGKGEEKEKEQEEKTIVVKRNYRSTPSSSNELKIWSRVSEKCGRKRHTVPLLGAWSTTSPKDNGGKPVQYFSAPYCQGGTLQDYIDRDERANELRNVLPDMVDVLICLRDNYVYHRDIKPDNIFLCLPPTHQGASSSSSSSSPTSLESLLENSTWLLGDFGISIDKKDYEDAVARREDVGSGGDGRFMAKEDVFGPEAVGYNFSSDIYSLGIVMSKIFHLIPFREDEKKEKERLRKLIIRMTDKNYLLRPHLEDLVGALTLATRTHTPR